MPSLNMVEHAIPLLSNKIVENEDLLLAFKPNIYQPCHKWGSIVIRMLNIFFLCKSQF